jgi:hypothetical protein
MIKANELRIGNVVINPHTKEICTVRGIKPNYKQTRNRSNGEFFYWLDVEKYDGMNVTVDLFSGIPITEDWLVRLGLEKSHGMWSRYFQESNPGFFYLELFENGKFHLTNTDYGKSSVAIEYVHQLQNLYFAITGEELTLKS